MKDTHLIVGKIFEYEKRNFIILKVNRKNFRAKEVLEIILNTKTNTERLVFGNEYVFNLK